MKEIREALWNDYQNVKDLISVVDNGDKELNERLFKERDDIRNEIIKLELSSNESEIKKGEIKAESEREKNRERINIIMFGISTCLSLYAVHRTFDFDTEGTITSTLGRNILNGLLPKIFKR